MWRTSHLVLSAVVLTLAGAAWSAEATSDQSAPPASGDSGIAARVGNADALLRLGDLYSDEDNANHDPAKALNYYQRAADAGNVVAKLRVGEMRVFGHGTQPDTAKGLSLIEEVAAGGDGAALALLGGIYSHADPSAVPIDLPRAYEYYRRAAAVGSATGILRSGEMLARGEGTAA